MLTKVLRVLIALLALGGVMDSVLALKVHNMDPGAAPPCAVTERFDCGAVNHSRYAVFPPRTFDEDPASKKVHVPVAVAGIAGYAVIFVLAAAGWWFALLQAVEIGFAGACFLSYIEAFVIEKWCIYCLWSQGLLTVILLLTICGMVARRSGPREVLA